MHSRLFCPFFAAVVLGTAMLGSPDRASAAIRITITDGADKVFYSPSSQTALFNTNLGAFEVVLLTTLTNFPGQSTGGVLSQTINLSDTLDPQGTTMPPFTFTAEVIEDVAGVSMGEVTGTQRDAVAAASLARFTLPNGSLLQVSSDVASAEPTQQAMAGFVQNFTTVNSVTVESLRVGVNTTVEAEQHELVANNPAEGYTLSSRVVLEQANVGVSGLAISASSGVTSPAGLIPEPTSLAVWGLGAMGLAFAGRIRKRLQLEANKA
jgi:hypothetical protein